MNSLRETGATLIQENDNNYKFILIDNNNKHNCYSRGMDLRTKINAPPKGLNVAPIGKTLTNLQHDFIFLLLFLRYGQAVPAEKKNFLQQKLFVEPQFRFAVESAN